MCVCGTQVSNNYLFMYMAVGEGDYDWLSVVVVYFELSMSERFSDM